MAERPWIVTFRAKGIEQERTIAHEAMADSFVTVSEPRRGVFVRHTYKVTTVDPRRKLALAVFERSR